MLFKYLVCILPLRALLVQTITAENLFVFGYNPSVIINTLISLLNLIFLFISFGHIITNKRLNPILFCITLLLFILLVRPLFSVFFTKQVADFAPFIRVLSWITFIPLVAISVKNSDQIKKISRSGTISFVFILVGLIIANILQIGEKAYDVSPLSIGFFRDEAPLAISLVMYLPILLLNGLTKQHGIKKGTLFLVIIDFVLILLILKRACMIEFVIGSFVIFLLLKKHNMLKANIVCITLGVGIVFAVVSSGTLLLLNDSTTIYEARFQDVNKYKKTGEIKQLGAGRLGSILYYSSIFIEKSIVYKIIGVDITSDIRRSSSGYLNEFGDVPHNDHLDFLLRNGIAGYFSYILFLLVIYFTIRRVRKRPLHLYQENKIASIMATGALIIYFLSSMVDNSFGRVLPMTIFAYLVGATFSKLRNENSNADKITAER